MIANLGIQQIIKAIEQMPKVKVGILGDKNPRDSGNKTNAEIGEKHELGEYGMPPRSFLRVPITNNIQKEIDKARILDEAALKKLVESGSFEGLLKEIGICAEACVQDAFDTGGDGKWPPNKPGYENNTGMILVDTQQLRNSITSKVSDE